MATDGLRKLVCQYLFSGNGRCGASGDLDAAGGNGHHRLVVQILLLHKADSYLVQQRLQNRKAQAKHQNHQHQIMKQHNILSMLYLFNIYEITIICANAEH